MSRGMLTGDVKAYTKQKLGFEITLNELRLIPYLHYLTVNTKRLEPIRINSEERKILSRWKKKGFVFGGASEPIGMSKEFWDVSCEVLWMSYATKPTPTEAEGE